MPKKLQKKMRRKGIPHDLEQFDGEVTGYAMPAPMAPGKVGSYYDDGEGNYLFIYLSESNSLRQ